MVSGDGHLVVEDNNPKIGFNQQEVTLCHKVMKHIL
jgi:hypothetical protein